MKGKLSPPPHFCWGGGALLGWLSENLEKGKVQRGESQTQWHARLEMGGCVAGWRSGKETLWPGGNGRNGEVTEVT